MLINLSNHPTAKWSIEQLEAAKYQYGKIIDMDFPIIIPDLCLDDVQKEAEKIFNEIKNILSNYPNENNAIHIMGEFTMTFNLLELLKQDNIPAVASTSSREVVEDEDGNKISTFNFIMFRNYY